MKNLRYRDILGLPFVPQIPDYQLKTLMSIRATIPELAVLPPESLIKLWGKFSAVKNAGWLDYTEDSVVDFWDWCTAWIEGGER